MIFAQAIAGAFLFRNSRAKMKAWLVGELAVCIFVAPWLPRYFDHSPEYVVGRLPIRFLLATPIGFVGGNALTLVLLPCRNRLGNVAQSRTSR